VIAEPDGEGRRGRGARDEGAVGVVVEREDAADAEGAQLDEALGGALGGGRDAECHRAPLASTVSIEVGDGDGWCQRERTQ
jgi:hypothetical protein